MEYKSKIDSNNFKKFNKMKIEVMTVPQQTNGYDCGIFLLQFVETFFKVGKHKISFFSLINIKKYSNIFNVLQNPIKNFDNLPNSLN